MFPQDANQCPPPDIDQLSGDSVLLGEIERAWNDSNPHARDVYSGQSGSRKVEQGGWIIMNVQTGVYRVERWRAGARDSIVPDPMPQVNYPDCVMAHFHTHPNRRSEGYLPLPSATDLAYYRSMHFPNGDRIPMIIRTHEGLDVYHYP